ncbi:HAD family phosphatase [soil metagenome]
MKRALVFDMDGLLLDSEAPIRDAWVSTARAKGYAATNEHFLEVVGRNEQDAGRIFRGYFGEGIPLEQISLEVKSLLERTLPPTGFALKPGALTLLEDLKQRGVPCAVATSTARTMARIRLLKAGLLPYFQEVSGGDEVARGKPEPDLFLLAAERLGLAPRDCLVLEDSGFGALGARQAGMAVIVVPDLKEPSAEVRDFALGVYPTLNDARPAIDDWLAQGR